MQMLRYKYEAWSADLVQYLRAINSPRPLLPAHISFRAVSVSAIQQFITQPACVGADSVQISGVETGNGTFSYTRGNCTLQVRHSAGHRLCDSCRDCLLFGEPCTRVCLRTAPVSTFAS